MANAAALARWLCTPNPRPTRAEGWAKLLVALAVVVPVALLAAWVLAGVLS